MELLASLGTAMVGDSRRECDFLLRFKPENEGHCSAEFPLWTMRNSPRRIESILGIV
jgi:hypothetical protein